VRRFDAAQPSVQRRSHAEQPAGAATATKAPHPQRRSEQHRPCTQCAHGRQSSDPRQRASAVATPRAAADVRRLSPAAPWAARMSAALNAAARLCTRRANNPAPASHLPPPRSGNVPASSVHPAPARSGHRGVRGAGGRTVPVTPPSHAACATQARTQPHCRSAPRVKAASYATKERRRAHERGLRSGHDRNAQRGAWAPAAPRAAIAAPQSAPRRALQRPEGRHARCCGTVAHLVCSGALAASGGRARVVTCRSPSRVKGTRVVFPGRRLRWAAAGRVEMRSRRRLPAR
jgi:hypothetical protein